MSEGLVERGETAMKRFESFENSAQFVAELLRAVEETATEALQ